MYNKNLPYILQLQVKQNKMEFTVQVPSHLYANKTEGLCGVCAGSQEHLVTSNGTITDDFDTVCIIITFICLNYNIKKNMNY